MDMLVSCLKQIMKKLLFDPFLTGNPVASISADEVECDYILLTHAHGDHYGDATQIAQKTGAKVISTPEVLTKLPSDYANVHGMNLGGSFYLPIWYSNYGACIA